MGGSLKNMEVVDKSWVVHIQIMVDRSWVGDLKDNGGQLKDSGTHSGFCPQQLPSILVIEFVDTQFPTGDVDADRIDDRMIQERIDL